ncbi:MAG: acetylornithine aminotransferase [Gammaproteobacteria bacterium BRH_c0]|nr:MAG: acetylornithine aminotransferase [Gammaproteobacteria bacterium BRH_c0]
MATQALMNTYGTRSLTIARGKGAVVWDLDGKSYLDALAGIAVCGLGHAHPAVTAAVTRQAETLVHCSNLYNIPVQQQLAAKLCQLSGMTNVFFGNSGAEANEAAIKLARLYGHSRKIKVPTIIVMEQAFHGRTMATLTATGNRKVQAGFEPLVSGFVRAPYNDIDALKTIALNNSDVVAILVEPIQGEGGVAIPDADYLRNLRVLCDQHQWLLMLDEVQTGNGRTGTFFNYQHSDILPDVVTTAKGLANGFPLGACLASGIAATLMKPGNHGSTFGGNPVACAAALATVDTIVAENLMARAASLGETLKSAFAAAFADYPQVKEIRGQGLMIGIELDRPAADLVQLAADAGLLINVTAERVVRLLPPLTLSDAEAQQLVDTLTALITTFVSNS